MNNDDLNKVLAKLNPKRIELYILNRLRNQHPEYSQQGASVTVECIKSIIKIREIVFSRILHEPPSMITDEEAMSILKKLPPAILKNPVSIKTIEIIISEHEQLITRNVMYDMANDEAFSASEYNNRAAARSEFERYDEALEDYNRACELEPDSLSFFQNRATLFLSLGMRDEALNDISYVNNKLTNEALDDISQVSDRAAKIKLFECMCSIPPQIELTFKFNQYETTLYLMAAYLRYLISLLPFTKISNEIIEIENDGMHMNIHSERMGMINFSLKEIKIYNKTKQSHIISELIKEANDQLLILKNSSQYKRVFSKKKISMPQITGIK